MKFRATAFVSSLFVTVSAAKVSFAGDRPDSFGGDLVLRGECADSWLEPISDNEIVHLDTILMDVEVRGSVGGFYSAPSVTVKVPPSNYLMSMVVPYARLYTSEKDGGTCMHDARVQITMDGRLQVVPYGERTIEIAHWNGSELDWNDQYDVAFLLMDIRCKYYNCVPDYSGGSHVGLRIREKI